MSWEVLVGDCVEIMASMDECSVDAIVTDPPYGLEFMGKSWDRLIDKRPSHDERKAAYRETGRHGGGSDPYVQSRIRYVAGKKAQEWHEAWAREALRVLKPGAHLLAFGGTRTYHRLTCAVEEAGFEIRDCLAWLYGSGFPKSLDVSKAIDKAAGVEREVERFATRGGNVERRGKGEQGATYGDAHGGFSTLSTPVIPDARRWQGWGTALKPAFEPIVLARKPLSERTVAANVLRWGTGALNIDGCRIAGPKGDGVWGSSNSDCQDGRTFNASPGGDEYRSKAHSTGRWPANVTLDEEAAALLDEHGDRGGASRFFYGSKASRAERDAGVTGPVKTVTCRPGSDDDTERKIRERLHGRRGRNHHPTVKPVDLMRWLVRLITPPGGLVLDPFAGSGTTGVACVHEGFRFVGIEQDAEYVQIARDRIRAVQPVLLAGVDHGG